MLAQPEPAALLQAPGVRDTLARRTAAVRGVGPTGGRVWRWRWCDRADPRRARRPSDSGVGAGWRDKEISP